MDSSAIPSFLAYRDCKDKKPSACVCKSILFKYPCAWDSQVHLEEFQLGVPAMENITKASSLSAYFSKPEVGTHT